MWSFIIIVTLVIFTSFAVFRLIEFRPWFWTALLSIKDDVLFIRLMKLMWLTIELQILLKFILTDHSQEMLNKIISKLPYCYNPPNHAWDKSKSLLEKRSLSIH